MTEAPQSDVKDKPVNITDDNPTDMTITIFIPLTNLHVQVKETCSGDTKTLCKLF